jgi:hypothetical protein
MILDTDLSVKLITPILLFLRVITLLQILGMYHNDKSEIWN